MSNDLSRKLGLHAGMRVLLVDPPPTSAEELTAAAPDVAFGGTSHDAGERYDVAMWWPRQAEGVGQRVEELSRLLGPAGAVWVVMPKKALAESFGVSLKWDEMQRAVLAGGDLVDNKTVSLGATHYATRFVVRLVRRKARGG